MKVRFYNRYGNLGTKKHYSAPHNSNGFKFSRSKTHGFHNSTARRKFYNAKNKPRIYFNSWVKDFRFIHGLRTPGHNNY